MAPTAWELHMVRVKRDSGATVLPLLFLAATAKGMM